MHGKLRPAKMLPMIGSHTAQRGSAADSWLPATSSGKTMITKDMPAKKPRNAQRSCGEDEAQRKGGGIRPVKAPPEDVHCGKQNEHHRCCGNLRKIAPVGKRDQCQQERQPSEEVRDRVAELVADARCRKPSLAADEPRNDQKG